MENHLLALQDMQAAPDPQGWETRPENKFNMEFDREVLNPNIPVWTCPPCQTGTKSLDDVWNSLEGGSEDTVHCKLTVENQASKMIIRFWAQFESINPEKIKGNIDGEEIIVTNYTGEKFQFALPGSIQGRTLHFLQVGDNYRQDINIPPNMVFFDSVPNNRGQFTSCFQMEAVYK